VKIHKHTINVLVIPVGQFVTRLVLPMGSSFLSCGVQHGDITLWSSVGSGSRVEQEVALVPTGQEIDLSATRVRRFLGRVDWNDLVFHVFVE
jgi:hypothetical protein